MSQASGSAAASCPVVAANWKMNGLRRDGRDLGRALAGLKRAAGETACDIVVCPPAALLFELRDALQGAGIALGGQDCHAEEKGAHTGDISAELLADCGCSYVILGHSERRVDHGETNEIVRMKVAAALRAGLRAILCVGESEDEREAGRALAVVGEQLSKSLPDGGGSGNIIVAYEPVWAIGTGRTATPAQAEAVHQSIRGQLAKLFNTDAAETVRLLYGGSVKPDNASALFAGADVDGALVGGASLKADSFVDIARAVT